MDIIFVMRAFTFGVGKNLGTSKVFGLEFRSGVGQSRVDTIHSWFTLFLLLARF